MNGIAERESPRYEDYIVSNGDSQAFLYFTDRENLGFLLKWGIPSRVGILGSLTQQPSDFELAKEQYRANRSGDTAVVVRIPLETWIKVRSQYRGQEILHPEIGVGETEAFIHPRLIQASICRLSDEVELNEGFMKERR